MDNKTSPVQQAIVNGVNTIDPLINAATRLRDTLTPQGTQILSFQEDDFGDDNGLVIKAELYIPNKS